MTYQYTEASLRPSLGMYALPYGTRYPELVTLLQTLYDEKVAPINWLPSNWGSDVRALNGGTDANGNRWVLIPAPASGPLLAGWLNTPEKRAWWDQFAMAATGAVGRYAANDAKAGAAELDAAYKRAAFWDTAYNIAYTLATPVRVAGAVASGTVNVLKSPFATFGLLALLGLGAFLYLKRKH